MCGVEVRGKKCIKQRENFMQWKPGVSLWEKKEKEEERKKERKKEKKKERNKEKLRGNIKKKMDKA